MRGFGTPLRTQPSQGGPQLWGQRCHRSPSRGRAAALGSHRAAAGSSSPTSQEHTHTPKKNPPTANRERNPGFQRPLTNPQRFLKESPCSLQSPGPAPAPLIPFCLLKSPPALKFGWAGAAERCSTHGDALRAGCRTCASRMPGAFWDARSPNCTETSPPCFLRPNPCFSPSPPSPSRSTQGEKILLARRGRTRAGEGAAAFVPPKFVPSARAG